jgi:uncharacterized protein YcnI
MQQTLRRACVCIAAPATVMALAPAAFGHAGMSPPVVPEGRGQLFSLTVPTEEKGLTTTQVELTVPEGFSVFSFAATPGWKRTAVTVGSGEETKVKSVKWTGGSVPLGEAAVFQFVGLADGAGDYRFVVRQTYSDDSVVNWSGPPDADEPAPVVEAKSSLGGGGGSTLAVVALILAGIAILIGLGGLVAGRGRQLA